MKQKIIIGGNYWYIQEMNKRSLKKWADPEDVVAWEKGELSGLCIFDSKRILIKTNDSREEVLNSIVHEGVHAICEEHDFHEELLKLTQHECAMNVFVAELVGYLKQVGVIIDEPEKKQRKKQV